MRQNENLDPCVQKLLGISRQQQKSIKSGVSPLSMDLCVTALALTSHLPGGVFILDTLQYAVGSKYSYSN